MIPRKGKRWDIKHRFPKVRGYGIFNCIFLVLVLSFKTSELKLQSKWHNRGERGWRAADVVKSWTFLSCFVSWSSSVYFSDKQRKCYNCQSARPQLSRPMWFPLKLKIEKYCVIVAKLWKSMRST